MINTWLSLHQANRMSNHPSELWAACSVTPYTRHADDELTPASAWHHCNNCSTKRQSLNCWFYSRVLIIRSYLSHTETTHGLHRQVAWACWTLEVTWSRCFTGFQTAIITTIWFIWCFASGLKYFYQYLFENPIHLMERAADTQD